MERIIHCNSLIILILALWFPFTLSPKKHDPADILPVDRILKPTLCGKLAFIDNVKTGVKLLGLIPCGESRPYIFNRRPGELHNYYRFQDVVIVKNKNLSISTANYGVIYTYINSFRDYVPIDSCNVCKDFTPTDTPDFTKPVIDCSTWILKECAAQFIDVINPTEIEKIVAEIEDDTYIAQTGEECNSDRDCLEKKVALRLGYELGGLLHQQSSEFKRVILFLRSLIIKPEGLQTCPSINRMTWHLTIGLDQRGYAIEILEITSPATPLLKDSQERQTGILEDGSVVEEIPDSGVAVTSQNIYVLFPSGNPINIQVCGTNFGSVIVSAVHNRGTMIQNVTFEGLLFTKSTRGSLDFVSSPPVFKIDTLDNENVEARNSDFYEEYPIMETWQIISTPTKTEMPTAPPVSTTQVSIDTSTAIPPSSLESSPTTAIIPAEKPSSPSLCSGLFVLAILPIVVFYQRKLIATHR